MLNGGRLELNAASSATVFSHGINIEAGRLVIDYVAGSDPVSTITALMHASYNGGLWDTGMIQSTALAGDLTLGWFDNTTSSANRHFPADSITIARTVPGDFNLDGSVDGADLAIWRGDAGKSGQVWAGDANFDNSVDGADLAIWRSNAGKSVVR